MNKKGFVMAETLVVILFVLIIFTILYNSVIPLLGRYEELSYYDDLDTTYDLFYIRTLIENDDNYENIVSKNYTSIGCANGTIANFVDCNNLFSALDIEYSNNIDIKDQVVFLKKSAINDLKNDNSISLKIKDYVSYVDLPENSLILQNDEYVSYIEMKLN